MYQPLLQLLLTQYTGKETTITNSGYRVEKYDIEVTIKNQPFTPYTNANGYECNLYYDIQVKAHFGENWRSSESYYPFDNIGQSSSKETVITFTLKDDGLWAKPPSGGQLDFRVKAYTGYWRAMPEIGFREPGLFREESSGWSDVQTITITYESSSPSPPSQTVSSPENPTSTSENNQKCPQQTSPPANILLGIIVILLCVIMVLVILVFRRQLKTPIFTNNPSQNSTSEVRCLYAESVVKRIIKQFNLLYAE